MLDTNSCIGNYSRTVRIHVSFVFSQLRVRPEQLFLQSQVCEGTAGWMCLRSFPVPPSGEWDQRNTWTPLASSNAVIYFHSHTKAKRTQPCTLFVYILCYEYGLLLWRVNKIFTVYKSREIVSLSAADRLPWPAAGQIEYQSPTHLPAYKIYVLLEHLGKDFYDLHTIFFAGEDTGGFSYNTNYILQLLLWESFVIQLCRTQTFFCWLYLHLLCFMGSAPLTFLNHLKCSLLAESSTGFYTALY